MAFVSPYTLPSRPPLAAAYIRASLARCDKHSCVVMLEVWDTTASRQAGYAPLGHDVREFPLAPATSGNPLDYAYSVLQSSGEFPDAIWNV